MTDLAFFLLALLVSLVLAVALSPWLWPVGGRHARPGRSWSEDGPTT